MQIEQVKRDVSQSGVMQVAVATIKATPKIFDMFANDTYANKPLAIMRELVANGIDAHVMAGCPQRPVEVQLPTVLDPTCRIRDFGTGMSRVFIMGEPDAMPPIPSRFMAYTDGSTKDTDDGQIGGFGIGSKAPLSYVDQFTLRVVHDGQLSVYTLFKGEDGIPAIGLQAETTTDEPNGVEVSFPVEDADIDTFAEAAQQALQYFNPLPRVTGGTLNAPDYTYVGNGWAMRPKAGPLGIIMGGVRYPATTNSFAYELRNNERLKPLLEYGLDLTLPIGACGVAMSREQLSYVPKTTTSVAAALEAVIGDVISTFATLFDDTCATEWEAMKLLATETGHTNSHSRSGRAQLLLANAKYKGEKLEPSFLVKLDDLAKLGLKSYTVEGWMVQPARTRRSSNCPAPRWEELTGMYGLTPYEIERVIIDDLPRTPKSKTVQRIRAYVSDQLQAKQTLIVRCSDDTVTPEQIKAVLRGPTDVVLTSALPVPVKTSTKTKSTRPRVRMFTYDGGTDRFTHRRITNLTPASSKRDSIAEIAYVNQPDKGIMVVMNSFDLPSRFHEQMDTGLVAYNELVFVNAADAPKIKATFLDFQDVFKVRLDAALAAQPDLAARLAVYGNSHVSQFSGAFSVIDSDRRYDDLSAAAKARPFGRMFEAWRTYVKPVTSAQLQLAPFVQSKLPAGLNPKALAAAIAEKQPEVAILLDRLKLNEPTHRALFFKNL